MSLKKAVLLFLLGGAVVPAIGQQIDLPGTARTPTSPANSPAANATRPKVDETALRYFASQGDTRRLEAETARLRALYPDWTPPTDLFGPVTRSDPELERMWQLYADGKYGDVRSAIAARQASEPSWVVPPELLARLDEGEARRRIVNASDAQQWGTVLRVATETPGVLTCANLDVLWRVAEAFGKTNAPDRAQDVYGYVLNTCTDTGERVATLQKAIQLLDEQRVAVLMKLERPGPDGQGEFAVLRDDLVRARMGRAAQDEKQIVPADDIATMERLAKAGTTPDDALLLGWYLYRHNEPARALDWFKIALDRNGGAKAAEGYVLTLMSGGRALEAEPVAYQWRDSTPENRKAYLDVVVSLLAADPPPRLDAGILARFSPVVIADKYVSGAQAIGWYAYNTGQLRTAATWFRTAVDWAPDDEPSAYGLGVTSLRLKDKATLDAIVARWRARSERILALVSPDVRRRLERQGGTPAAGLVPQPAMQQALPPLSPVAPVASRNAPLPPIDPVPAAASAPRPRVAAAPVELAPEVDDYAAPISKSERRSYGGSPGGSTSSTGAAAALNSKRFGQCVAITDAGFRAGRLAPTDALARGWCLMELLRPMEAAAAFDLAIKYGSGKTAEDAAYGKSLAYLRKGMTNAAQVAAIEAPQDPRRSTQLSADILAQRAQAAYNDERYVEAIIALDERSRLVPEQQDLMMLRGWSYYHLRDLQSADRIFKALAATGNPDAQAGVSAILALTKKVRDG
jgi:tetratricopeptide (TPR) repeat protein